MLDYSLLAWAMLIAAVTGGGALLGLSWLGRERNGRGPRGCWLSAGWILGMAAGFYAGCMMLDQWPRWPPLEDRDRFLTVLLPLAIGVEITAAAIKSRWGSWLARGILAASATPILLYNTVYLADLRGPNSAQWSSFEAAGISILLGSVVLGVWGLMAWLQARAPDRTSPLALALVALTAGITVMLSGYYRGGLLGLPLAAAIIGATLASWTVASPGNDTYFGIGLISIFSLLVIGHFFGSLQASSALFILLSPLMAWIVAIPALQRMPKPVLQTARVLLVAAPLVLVVLLAKWRFDQASSSGSHPSDSSFQPTLLDN